MNCCDYRAIPVTITAQGSNRCPYVQASSQGKELAFLAPEGMCLFAWSAVYPYYLTLTNGGWFSWVKKGDGPLMQCCGTTNRVFFRVVVTDAALIQVKVEAVHGQCPHGYLQGATIILNPSGMSVCPKAVDAFFPYLMLVSQGRLLPWEQDDTMAIRCPNQQCGNVVLSVKKRL